MSDRSRPPRLAVALLRRLTPPELAEVVEGDLLEGHRRRSAERGRFAADVWAWKQVLGSRPRQARRAVRDHTSADGGLTRAGGLVTAGGIMRGGVGTDVREAMRGLRLRPALSLAVIATVAVAVAATTSVFSVVNGVLLRPLDYPQPDRLVRLWQSNPEWLVHPSEQFRLFAVHFPLSVPTFLDWQAATTSLESVGITSNDTRAWQGPERTESVQTTALTHGAFEALGVPPILGRPLLPEDDAVGAPAVATLSYGFWQLQLGGAPDVVGTTIILDRAPHIVVGVMPAGFGFPGGDDDALWTTLTDEQKSDVRDNQSYTGLGRIRPGADLASVSADLEAIQARLSAEYPDEQKDFGVTVEGLLESEVVGVRTTLLFLLGAVGLVLAIASLNIANMLSVMGLVRRRELAVRAALGAARGRLIRKLLVESALLAGIGGLVGVALAWIALPALVRTLPTDLPRIDQVSMDSGVLLFGLFITTATALAVGVLPALQAGRVDPGPMLVSGGRGAIGAGGRVRSTLVVAEVAMAFLLLVGAGLLGRSYMKLWSEDRGFPTEGLALLSVTPDEVVYPDTADRKGFVRDLSERMSSIPGARVTAANQVPLAGSLSATSYNVELSDGTVAEEASMLISSVLTNYLDVMEIPLLAGRDFSVADDRSSPPVAIVNQALADEFWPGATALGRRLRPKPEADWVTVIGVARNVRHSGLDQAPQPKLYVTSQQNHRVPTLWVVRTASDVDPVLDRARDIVSELSPTTAVNWTLVVDDFIAQSVAVPRFRTVFVVGLATLATVLALLGVYGVVAFAVSQRTRELALRMALGARPGEIVGSTLWAGFRLCALGLLLGGAVSLLATRLLESFLYEMPVTDPLSYAAGVLLISAVGLAAGFLPARRAAQVDPMTVLKSE